MDFAQKLDFLMKERGMSNYKLSKLMHCSQSSVANWLSKDVTPQDRTVEQIASVFGVTVNYLLGKEDKKTPDLKNEIGNDLDDELVRMLTQLDAVEVVQVRAYIQGLLASHKD